MAPHQHRCFVVFINLFSDAEVREDVVEGLLRCDLSACDVGKGIEGESEVFGKEVARELGLKTL